MGKGAINNSSSPAGTQTEYFQGSENTTYFHRCRLSDMYGIVKTSRFERFRFQGSMLTQKLIHVLKVGLNTSFSASSQNYPMQSEMHFQSPIQWVYTLSGIYPVYMRDEKGILF